MPPLQGSDNRIGSCPPGFPLIGKVYVYTVPDQQIYHSLDFSREPLDETYEQCQFEECLFENCNLGGIQFIECTFKNCNFSNCLLAETGLKDVVLKNCKILGVDFAGCNPFLLKLQFHDCVLDLSNFHGMKLDNTLFEDCRLREVDFGNANLSGSMFKDCALTGALFDYTNLRNVDFRTAQGYMIDPESNQLAGARFSAQGLEGLLGKYGIIVEE